MNCCVIARVISMVARAFSGSSGWLLVGYILVYVKRATSRCEQLTQWKPTELAKMMLGRYGCLTRNCYVIYRVISMVARAFSGWLLVVYILVYVKIATSRCEQLTQYKPI